MVKINFARREINLKLVYYGPPLSGKTTNLEVVHKKAPASKKGELTSIVTEGDRTLFFDYVPLDLGKVGGMAVGIDVYTVPGQVYYNATRKLVLQGADGVVFVADSQPDKMEENLESLQNLEDNLKEQGLDIRTMPLVLEWNKRDLPNVLPPEELDKKLNKYGAPTFEAVAVKGEGVLPTLEKLARMVLEKIAREYGDSLPKPPPPPKPGGGKLATPTLAQPEPRRESLLARGAGLLARGAGLLARGVGLLARGVGLLASETARFLGPEEGWSRCSVRLHDIAFFGGGRAVSVAGSGEAFVRIVGGGRIERRFSLSIGPDEARSLLRQCVEQDLLAVEESKRPGVPDEPRIALVLEDARGRVRHLSTWERDQTEAFRVVAGALKRLVARTEGREPDYVGPYDDDWSPFPGIRAWVLGSGRHGRGIEMKAGAPSVRVYPGPDDPSFWFRSAPDLETLRARLAGLRSGVETIVSEKPQHLECLPDIPAPRGGAGRGGILLVPCAVPGFPKQVVACRGKIVVIEEGRVVHHDDVNGLEAWLLAQARSRGITA